MSVFHEKEIFKPLYTFLTNVTAQNFFKQVVVKVIYLYSLMLNKVSVGKVEIPSYQHL